MQIRRYGTAAAAVVLLCGALCSCGSSGSSDSSEVPTAAPIDTGTEEAVGAESGDAFLYITDEQFWIQYTGKKDDPSCTMLSYGAGVPHISGNGKYTVSVNADTKGFRYDTAGDADDDSVTPLGLAFSAVVIKDGKQLYPDAVITIDAIRVDGREIELTAKNYTSSDDGVELRSNIYNTWVGELPSDAVSTEGHLSADDTGYSPCIIDPAEFSQWTKVEVDFTVSGI